MRLQTTTHRYLKAFTLLELLIVIVIIGLLASYVGPKYFAHLNKSEVTAARAQIEAFSKALDAMRVDIGRYPRSDEGLRSLLTAPSSMKKWNGPYLSKEVPLDPWGNHFIYRSPANNKDFEIISYGKDGLVGGDAENADIKN